MSSLTKTFSAQLKRKAISHIKLPKIVSPAPIKQNAFCKTNFQVEQNQFLQRTKKNLSPISKRVQLTNLYEQRGSSMITNKIMKSLTQQNQHKQTRENHNKSTKKLVPISKQEQNIAKNYVKLQSKHKIIIQSMNLAAQKTDSAGSSRTSLHPVVQQIQALISQQIKKLIVPVKCYNQSLIGSVSAKWWSVTDSLFYSLQKILKVKKIQKNQTLNRQNKKQHLKTQSPSPSKNMKSKRQLSSNQYKRIYGTVQSNTKASIQISKVYSCIHQQIYHNQQRILSCYEDSSHTALILQSMFFQKSVIYLLASLRKWCHDDELLLIHSLAIQYLPCIIECRRLAVDILMQSVQNERQDNKIRKPKYIARQKKLIQISKFVSMMKAQYQKYLNSLGSPNRYKNFTLPQNLIEHQFLKSLQTKWKLLCFDTPVPPYLKDKKKRKDYLIVIQPLNLLYKYNKKQQSIFIDPYAELFLQNIGQNFDIVFFTALPKQSSLLNFLGILYKAQIMGVLDKHHLTYLNAKPVKNISNIGGEYSLNKILTVDLKQNYKYYTGCKHSLLLVQGINTQTKTTKLNGRLIKTENQNEYFLENLCSKITKCALKGGHWQQIINQKHSKAKQIQSNN